MAQEVPSAAAHGTHLGDAINIATRPAHAELNKAIIFRLPLALPPKTANPSVYASGLLHVAVIYTTFESLWQSILQVGVEGVGAFEDEGPLVTAAACEPPSSAHITSILSRLLLPDLLRSSSLRADIRSLTGWPDHRVENELRFVAIFSRLSLFVNHIKRSVEENPHVLLAYAWVFYMALFRGGRIIRDTLEASGQQFWTEPCTSIQTETLAIPCAQDLTPSSTLPLAYFRFNTPRDGDDLKDEFKKRLLESEVLLSEREREQIVQEAGAIFEYTAALVEQLDRIFEGSTAPSPTTSEEPIGWANVFSGTGIRNRVRDSVAVAKERALRRRSRADSKLELDWQDDAARASTYTTSPTSLNVQGTVSRPAKQETEAARKVQFKKFLKTYDKSNEAAEHPVSRSTDGVLDGDQASDAIGGVHLETATMEQMTPRMMATWAVSALIAFLVLCLVQSTMLA